MINLPFAISKSLVSRPQMKVFFLLKIKTRSLLLGFSLIRITSKMGLHKSQISTSTPNEISDVTDV